MDIIAKNLKGGGKTLTYLLAGVFALAASGAWAAATESNFRGDTPPVSGGDNPRIV